MVGADDFTVRGGAADASIHQKQVMAEQFANEYRIPLIRLIEGTGGGGSVKSLDTDSRTYIPGNPGWDWVVKNLSTILYEPTPISITIDSIIDIVTYGVNDGAIYITPNGGTGPLNVTWTSNNGFNSNLEDIIDLYPATYQLNVTDSNLCAYNEIFEIIQPSSLWISE